MPNRRRVSAADTAPNLSISTEKVCFVIAKVREFDAKDVLTDEDDASNPSDDRMVEVLEDHDDDPVLRELSAFIGAMSEDEKVDLIALTWLGRGDGGLEDWPELRAEAARSHGKRAAAYLLARRSCPITWKRRSRSSAARARTNSDER